MYVYYHKWIVFYMAKLCDLAQILLLLGTFLNATRLLTKLQSEMSRTAIVYEIYDNCYPQNPYLLF